MTYALPWRYSTTELKGPIFFISLMNKSLAIMSLFILIYIYMYIDIVYCTYISYPHSGPFRNDKLNLSSEYRVSMGKKKMVY